MASMISDAIRQFQNERLITRLLEPGCPVCGAEPGAWCDYGHPDFGPGTEMLQLDTELYICTARAQIAIDARRVQLGAILRRVPEWSQPPSLHAPSQRLQNRR